MSTGLYTDKRTHPLCGLLRVYTHTRHDETVATKSNTHNLTTTRLRSRGLPSWLDMVVCHFKKREKKYKPNLNYYFLDVVSCRFNVWMSGCESDFSSTKVHSKVWPVNSTRRSGYLLLHHIAIVLRPTQGKQDQAEKETNASTGVGQYKPRIRRRK